MKKKPKLTSADVWVELSQVGYGCQQALAWRRGWPWPIGIVWFTVSNRRGGSLVVIGHSYVPEPYRRQGIRTLMHKAIAAAWPKPIFVTGNDPSRSGSAWMKAMGYEENGAGMMVLVPWRRKP